MLLLRNIYEISPWGFLSSHHFFLFKENNQILLVITFLFIINDSNNLMLMGMNFQEIESCLIFYQNNNGLIFQFLWVSNIHKGNLFWDL